MTSRGARAFIAALALVIAGVVLAGCGIPTQNNAQALTPTHVPFHLLSPVPPTSTPTTAAGYVREVVYLTSTGQSSIQAVVRFVAPPATLTDILNVLLRGPTTAEQQTGLETALNRGVHLFTAHITNGVCTVDLNTAFARISGPLQIFAVAQIVFTIAAEAGSAVAVGFEINGFATPVPNGYGALLSRPVKTSDYSSIPNKSV